jgi:hypothetical protein
VVATLVAIVNPGRAFGNNNLGLVDFDDANDNDELVDDAVTPLVVDDGDATRFVLATLLAVVVDGDIVAAVTATGNVVVVGGVDDEVEGEESGVEATGFVPVPRAAMIADRLICIVTN